MIYHASQIEGLHTLKPQVSTHGKAYVYGIRSKLMAMLFGAPKDDFDLLIDGEDGKPVVYECYPDALKKVYSGKSCQLYTLEETGFLSGMTGWEEELVCPCPVTVLKEEHIPDIYAQLMLAAGEHRCSIHLYEGSDQYLSFLREELQERVKAFGITGKYMDTDSRFTRYHNKLLGRQG